MAPIPWHRIKLLIVDLDDTLCDTLQSLSIPKRRETEERMQREGLGKYVPALRKSNWAGGFEAAMHRAGVPKAHARRLRTFYDRVSVAKLKLYPDVTSLLKLTTPKVLLTRGNTALQKKKLRHLGIRKHFDEIVIIDTHTEKKATIQKLVKKHKLAMKEALIIGDRLGDEITYGKQLGIPTVRVKRKGQVKETSRYKPDITVRTLNTVAKRLK